MKLMIIDGHALIFRAYYAFQTTGLKNSITGRPSGAVFGFFRMLFKLIQDFTPSHLAVTFDPGTPLERGKIYEAYKANRAPMPEDLRPQTTEIYEICEALTLPMFKIDGQEADDIIATLCRKFSKSADLIHIFSGDKDLYQILDDHIHMLRGKKGATEFIEIDPKWVETEIGVKTSQIPDFMGIVGDTSDNIPGVKGIGDKGASKLIAEFGDLETIYKNISSIKNPGLVKKLEESKEMAFLSRKLATLDSDLKFDVDKKMIILPDYLKPELLEVFHIRGYNVLYRDLKKISIEKGHKFKDTPAPETSEKKTAAAIAAETGEAKDKQNQEKGKYELITSISDLQKIVKKLKKAKVLSVDTETTSKEPVRAEILGSSFTDEEGKGWYVSFQHKEGLFAKQSLPREECLEILKPLLEEKKVKKVGQNIKYDYIVFSRYGINLNPICFDTMLASYVIHPESRRHGMDDLAADYLGYKTITYDDLTGKGKKRKELHEIDPNQIAEYAGEDADITFRLYKILEKELQSTGTMSVLDTIEQPLIPVLAAMETAGVSIDTAYFKKLSKEYKDILNGLEKSIHKAAGKNFNIASTRELQQVLYEDLKLPVGKKIQTGYSTDHSVLEDLQGKHEIIDFLLEHRKYSKLVSTYIDTLPLLVNPETGRIHTNYNQTIAVTGRLSSTDPNLQNIPIKDKEGREIRKGFIADKDFEILSLDYSQIELRIMAHFSKDEKMTDAYNKNLDIHARTASALFAVDEKKVTPEMRTKAKAVNFSVIYGSTAYGLAQNMRISRSEAGLFIDKYFLQYPGVKKFMEDICNFCFQNGYVETLTGRRRYVPDIKATNRQAIEAAKRIAINSPIQGTSADMIKLAMLRIHDELKKKKAKSRMIMQVHDELVFEVHKSEKDLVFESAKKIMENVVRLDVPIIVQGKFGKNWDEAH
ncbi:MAG TPA: DNA polymerase I [Leptospiraceae bacterium]|nr:DNA polymerase I [Leptospiraceae bacterium]